jgi:hypothetical protein
VGAEGGELVSLAPHTPSKIKTRGTFMKSLFLALFFSCFALAGGAFGQTQEFRTTPRVVPQPEPPRAAIEQNSNSDIARQFLAAPNKLQMINPLAPRRYGSGEQVVAADRRDRQERGRYWKVFSFTF